MNIKSDQGQWWRAVRYDSRPNIDQRSRDLIEDLGLHSRVNAEVAEVEDHLARIPVAAKQGNAQLGRA